ncbi:MAG: Fe-S cluster assembly protein SufD, partial [Halothiobacillus sp.]|nr:Fe-S cluster assembly protein SufD [Halothiobacillus sp.]
ADIKPPIVLEFLDAPGETAAQTRVLVRCGPHSRATLIETATGADGVTSWRNSVLVAALAANSQLTHLSLGLDGDARLLTDRSFVTLARDARYRSINIQLGGQLVRREIDVNITDTGAHCDLFGLMMPRAKQVLDTHTRLIHGAAHTTSNEQYQIIADESGRGIFKGRILVAQDAQKIEAFQNSRNLLLSDSAEIDTKPELEIYADDVKCSHGATIGRLDDEALYYLKSRGISSKNARKLLITGFAQEIVDQLPTPELVAWLGQIIARRLERPQAK